MNRQQQLQLLPENETDLRISGLKDAMRSAGVNTIVLCENTNLFYLTGRVFCGYSIYNIDTDKLYFFVKRPVTFNGENIIQIRKPEQIAENLHSLGLKSLGNVALELDSTSFSATTRLAKALGVTNFENADSIMRVVRARKTPMELDMIRHSGICHERVYRMIPRLYTEGMTDIELQIEIERASRLEGCLGIFRVAGNDMELYMGNILAGDNADAPSPYDFAMGGAGADPSLPVGADGTIIRPGQSVMVDVNGNYTGYMTDMTRTFTTGELPDKAYRAHEVSRAICHELASMGKPGIEARSLYDKALSIAKNAGLEHYFMGHRQHAGFVGHGLGIVINENPVIAPRSKDILEPGNVIALEPKFVIPNIGAVGIENTYIVNENGAMECVTNAPEQILTLGD